MASVEQSPNGTFSRALCVWAALIAGFIISPAFADDESDCNRGESPEVMVEACTRLIGGGAVEGNGLADTFTSRAHAYARLGRLEDSENDVARAIELDPHNAGRYVTQARIRNYFKRYDAALDSVERALAIDPKHRTALNTRGVAYLRLKDYRAAVEAFTKSLEVDPRWTLAYNNRCRAHLELAHYDLALQDCNKSIRIRRQSHSAATAIYYRGRIYFELGLVGSAIIEFDQALEIASDRPHPYQGRGMAYARLGQYEQAIAEFGKAIELYPEMHSAFFHRGQSYWVLGELELARQDFEAAIALDPENDLYKGALGGLDR